MEKIIGTKKENNTNALGIKEAHLSFDLKALENDDFTRLKGVLDNFKHNAIHSDNSLVDIEKASIDIIGNTLEVTVKYKKDQSKANIRRMFKAGANSAMGQNFLE